MRVGRNKLGMNESMSFMSEAESSQHWWNLGHWMKCVCESVCVCVCVRACMCVNVFSLRSHSPFMEDVTRQF